jgi:flagellar basal body-associated protein FliL
MDRDRLATYEEQRQQAYKRQTNVGKQKLSKIMIVVVALLEISAMGGMAYLIYLFYFK